MIPALDVKTNVRAAVASAGHIMPRILRRATAKGLPAQVSTPGAVALVDLRDGQCRFPIGDPHDPDFGFCGLPRHDVKRSYCLDHLRRAYSTPVCEAVA